MDCYVHNVKPDQNIDKKIQWFDCTLQTTQENIRAVICFEPTQADVTKFKDAAESKSPIKVKNTRINKRQLTDAAGSVKLVLWRRFTTEMQNNQTNEFQILEENLIMLKYICNI